MQQIEGKVNSNVDILVVGAGVTGIPLALSLHRQGLNVLLVEKSSKQRKIFKGEYLQPAASNHLRQMGFSDLFHRPSSDQVTELRFTDLDQDNQPHCELSMKYPPNTAAMAISHFDLLSGLHQTAKKELGHRFLTGTRIRPINSHYKEFKTQPLFELKKDTQPPRLVQPKWVIGCDGRQSTVRSWIGGTLAPKNKPVTLGAPPEFILGAQIETPAPKRNRYEVIRTYKTGTLSAFSLKEEGQRLYFSAQAQGGSALKKSRPLIQKVLDETQSQLHLGHLSEKSPLVGAPAYGSWLGPASWGCFLLAGDALAVTSPYGGQGMTAAMEHIQFLTEHFDFTTSHRKKIKAQLHRYTDQTQKIYQRISLLNFGLYYLFFAPAPLFKKTTNHIVRTWEDHPYLKERVMRLFAGIDQNAPSLLEISELWGLSRWPRHQLKEVKKLLARAS